MTRCPGKQSLLPLLKKSRVCQPESKFKGSDSFSRNGKKSLLFGPGRAGFGESRTLNSGQIPQGG